MAKLDEIIQKINSGKICEVSIANVELKSSWSQDYGTRISAIANELTDHETGYLIVGVSDSGQLIHSGESWLKDTEQRLSSHIRQFLSPTHAVSVQGQLSLDSHYYIVLAIENPGDITSWNHKAYKRVGTQAQEMTPDERLDLSLRLPGQDYSKRPWQGSVSAALIEQFAQKLVARNSPSLPLDLTSMAPSEILMKIHCQDRMASKILFGNLPLRIAYYDEAGDVIDQVERQGAFYLLSDDFIAEINRWTKSKGTVLGKHSIAAAQEDAYPRKALRECLANAVSHALYERDNGEVIVDLHIDRIVIRNNCGLEVKKFAQEWFSKKSWSRNKFLMQLLREAGFTDELGSGKTRLYSQMLEAGKREPVIEYYEKGTFACWQITLYNEQNSKPYTELLERFKSELNSLEEARLATALTLWRQQKWSEILRKLDEHYQNLARRIVQNVNSPIVIFGDEVFTKRWVNSALAGQHSMAFTSHEESQLRKLLHLIAYTGDRNGKLNTKEAKRIIGLSNTPSESTQLSNLFRKWRSEGLLKDGSKRGEWLFVQPPTERFEVISSEQQGDGNDES